MIAFFARHPTAANLLMLGFLIAGLLSLPQLRRETFPDFSSDEVQVRVVYPGATPEEVEEAIVERVEDALDGVRFVEEVRSEAREGVALVTVKMQEDGDFFTFKDEVDTAVSGIPDLPPEAEEPVLSELHATEQVLALLVSGPMSATDLEAHCRRLEERLEALPQVSLVDIKGFSDRQLRVELSEAALRRYQMSVSDVAAAVERQSLDLPAGGIETRQRELLLRFVEARRTPAELAQLVVLGGPRGAEVRLGELGRVSDRYELDEEKIFLGTERAGLLEVRKNKTQDTIRVAEAVKAFVADERARQPAVRLAITQDTSVLVSDRLNLLVRNAWQGLVLVFLVMWLFFNVRLSFWVVMSLPVSFLAAFLLMPLLGLTINMLTMIGLLLALGLLMDDGIVIAENIATHAARGKPAMQAAIDGVSEVKAGVLSSFFTTVCVLGPAVALDGTIGKVLVVVPVMLILVVAVSLIEAFWILPAHLGHSLHGHETERAGLRRRFDAGLDRVREMVIGGAIDRLLRWRYLWVGTVVLIFLVTIGMLAGGVLKFQAFPDLDGDVIQVRLLMPPGTPLERTEQVVQRLIGGINEVNKRFQPHQPDGKELVRTVYTRFNLNTEARESGSHVATVTVDLLTAEERSGRVEDIIKAWREEVGAPADVVSLLVSEPALGPAGRAIHLRFSGLDLARLRAVALETKQWLQEYRGVYNLDVDVRPGKEEVRIRLQQNALGRGLDVRMVAGQLRAAFQGRTVDQIQVDAQAYEVDVRLQAEDRDSLADLEYFELLLPDGTAVPLSTVAHLEVERGWARIPRVDGRPTVTLRGDLDPQVANTADLVAQLRRELVPDLESRHPGLAIGFEGEVKEAEVTQASMQWALLVGLMGVFILLSFQFRSYVEPLVVMVAIPLALIGVVWGHLAMGLPFSMPSMLGFVSLSGIVVNDSILLVLFLKKRRAEGAGFLQAAGQASRERFRAILITSLTTIAGLTPLLFEKSLQAQVLIPLAASIAFGLLASTVLVLLVIPALYAILADLGLVRERPLDAGPE